MGQHREVRTIPRLQKHKFAPLFRILDDGDYLQDIGEEGAMRARLRLLTAGNSYIVPQCGDIVGIHNVDPSQVTLARWERFCAAMDDLAKRQGGEYIMTKIRMATVGIREG